jgi:thiol peroxidase
MATITLKGNPIETVGELPAVNTAAPAFTLTGADLADVTLDSRKGKKLVLNIFPSIDTPVCEASVRKFNDAAASLDGVHVLCISADLPFALKRFCGAEGIDAVEVLSEFRTHAFGDDYGCRIATGPLAGLLSRAIVVLDASGTVLYTEQVPEIASEPDYDAALAVLR